jgi:hypothetical protein
MPKANLKKLLTLQAHLHVIGRKPMQSERPSSLTRKGLPSTNLSGFRPPRSKPVPNNLSRRANILPKIRTIHKPLTVIGGTASGPAQSGTCVERARGCYILKSAAN